MQIKLKKISTKGWLPSKKEFNKALKNDKSVVGIEDGKILVKQASIKPLSSLRGELTKQSGREIDKQISDLRNEWNREQ